MTSHVQSNHFWEICFYLFSSLIFISGGVAWAVVPRLWPEWSLPRLPFPEPAFIATRSLGPGRESSILKANCDWNCHHKEVHHRLRFGDAIDRRIALQVLHGNISLNEETRTIIRSIIEQPNTPDEHCMAVHALEPPYSQLDTQIFIHILDHSDPWMKRHAAEQLELCSHPDAVSALLRISLMAKLERDRIPVAMRCLGQLPAQDQQDLVNAWWMQPDVQRARATIAEQLTRSFTDRTGLTTELPWRDR